MGALGGYLGYGILRSSDAGQSWTHVSNDSLPAYLTVRKLVVDPGDPNRVDIAVDSFVNIQTGAHFSGGGLYLSTDGGVNWALKLQAIGHDIVIAPDNPQTLYCAISSLSGPRSTGVYRSTDGGSTWGSNPFYTGPYGSGTADIKISMSSADPQTLWVYSGDSTQPYANSTIAAVNTSNGSVISWPAGPNSIDTDQFSYNTYIAADPSLAGSVYIGSRDVWRLTRNGDNTVSWTNLTKNRVYVNGAWNAPSPYESTAHIDQHAIAFSPTDSSVIFIGCDGGLYTSADAGQTFQPMNDSLVLEQFYSISMDVSDPTLFFGGLQDNGTQRKLANASAWNWWGVAGDGGSTVIDPVNPNIVFAVDDYLDTSGSVYRSNNDGRSLAARVATAATFGEPDSGGRIAFIPAFTGNQTDATLYYGTWRVFTSTDLGTTWNPTGTTDLTSGGQDYLRLISVSSANPQVIYTASNGGRVMVSSDGGLTWTDVSGYLPNRTVTSISIDPGDPTIAYLTVSGYGTGHVFKTMDSGLHWLDISGNLPNVPANALLIDRVTPGTLYVGTDIGVFRSEVDGNSWDLFNNGLPPVVVTTIAAQPGGLIRIGTWGRGAYELIVPDPLATSFNVANRGGLSLMSAGSGDISIGYARIQPNSISSAPSGVAIFDYRKNGILVSETGVPASPPLTSGRMYVEVGGSVDTGIALANPNNADAKLTFYFTDGSGNQSGAAGSVTIPANQQIAQFVDQAPFNVYGSPSFQGSLSFTSTVPVGIVALRGLTNERGEFLMSTLPVIDTSLAPNTGTVVIPHFADGGGWQTQIFLINPTSNAINGNISFRNPTGQPTNVTVGTQTGSTFPYAIPAGAAQKLMLAGTGAVTATGEVWISGSGPVPTPLLLFSYKPAGITVSEAGVPVVTGTVFRSYVESSNPQSGNIQSGIALANNSTTATTVTIEVTDLNGVPVSGLAPVSIPFPGSAQTAKFLSELFPALPNPFKGVLRISSNPAVPLSLAGLRSRINERGDFLITTTPPTVDNSTPPTGELLFPHFVNGGGYTTQFILFNGIANQSNMGNLRLFSPNGVGLSLPISP